MGDVVMREPAPRPAYALPLLALLAVLPYVPLFWQPFVSDDYIQIYLARIYGPAEKWGELAADTLYRSRATSLVMTYWTERLFGQAPFAFYATSIALHVLNTWLVYAAGSWPRIGWPVSAVAAGFFAVYLGHQEAVMWYAAVPELLVFLFILVSLLAWVRWIEAGGAGWYLLSAAAFGLGLLSKESAVVVIPLALAVGLVERRTRRALVALIPMAAAAVFYGLAIFAAGQEHLHLNDGTFSLGAPFWMTILFSTGRMLWVWGLVSLIALTAWRAWPQWRTLVAGAAVWAGVCLLPYSFLTYMPRIPSRHTYLASAGLAVLVAAGFLAFRARVGLVRPWAVPLLAAVIVTHHVGYVTTKKREQFLERARPTEELVRAAAKGPLPVYVKCFPYGIEVAWRALDVRLNLPPSAVVQTATPPEAANVLCSTLP
ncbi:MAG: hypothetical protein FJW39_28530 [Acidobacteria bacterium]|nr:hypothetical protein [Acidobacteriota bacterium]